MICFFNYKKAVVEPYENLQTHVCISGIWYLGIWVPLDMVQKATIF